MNEPWEWFAFLDSNDWWKDRDCKENILNRNRFNVWMAVTLYTVKPLQLKAKFQAILKDSCALKVKIA